MTQRPLVAETTRPHSHSGLSCRDVEVLRCLAAGASTARIAAVQSVSSNTVRTRIRRIQGKLHVADRQAMVRVARDLDVRRIPRPRGPVR
jgi:ATP/maltotriose-dependent transcriptional regulator MalT